MKILTTILFLIFSLGLFAQNDPKWDDTKSKDWPTECKKVEIKSTLDNEKQAAYFFKCTGSSPRPLVVSLHSWSADYEQIDSISWKAINKNYNYIHPDFRGPNKTQKACGSPFVIQDIDDAITYAINNSNVDLNEIHITGSSGGGNATLLAYMKSKHQVKTFSAWVPISNLVDWYYESVGRKNKYAHDIAMATTGIKFKKDDYYYLNETEAKSRSPYFMSTPIEQRQNSKLYIFTGIHDGYKGSVPITQSLKFYNKVVADFDSIETESLITNEEMLSLVERRNSNVLHPSKISNGDFHFERSYEGKVKVGVFEGGHERIESMALAELESSKILTIGDSNGAHKQGWVNQLKTLLFSDFIYNTSSSGNTIGFDNNGNQSKNTLRQIDNYLQQGTENLKGLDKIIIMLGTNDCKAVFNDSLALVPENMKTLIAKIKAHSSYKKYQPEICIVSPPPCSNDDKMKEKYHGSALDIAWLQSHFKEIAEKEGCVFIDTYSELLPIWDQLTVDGIHLTPKGQKMIAKLIQKHY
jgi:lysophospholipase L1-like esterase/dienelactone hydrolase